MEKCSWRVMGLHPSETWHNTYLSQPLRSSSIPVSTNGSQVSPSNCSCVPISPSTSLWINQRATFCAIRTVLLGLIRWWGFGVLICRLKDQSGTRGRDFCLYVSSPLAQRAHFPLPRNIEHCVSLAKAETWKASYRSREEKASRDWDQRRAELPPEERSGPRAASQLCCSDSHAAWPLSCFSLNRVFFFTAHQIGDSVGIELVPRTSS